MDLIVRRQARKSLIRRHRLNRIYRLRRPIRHRIGIASPMNHYRDQSRRPVSTMVTGRWVMAISVTMGHMSMEMAVSPTSTATATTTLVHYSS